MRRHDFTRTPPALIFAVFAAAFVLLSPFSATFADVPSAYVGGQPVPRPGPAGTSVPNPGTQEQELANITAPAPYNVFEFVVTCAACHGGTIDQNAGHFGNWAGSNMASALRDPVFRAVQISLNSVADGAGNLCIRCHSPNAWLSGRTDPLLNGDADGSSLIHSILLSTDDEGILCESCHRAIGSVTMKRADLDPNDPVWNKLLGIYDWPHQGDAYTDGPVLGLPFGDSTLQFNDGMVYGGKYSGSVNMYFSDFPLPDTDYTGQTYAIQPPGYPSPGSAYIAPDGSVPLHFEDPIGPPPEGNQLMALSLEHPTFKGDFVRSPEFCGSCHDLTVPIFNSGMPEQRTYSEWKYSEFGRDPLSDTYRRCQDCHMPTMMHEYADNAAVSLNPDPTLAGWFPYAKDRNLNDPPGTAFHRFDGANRDLPDMMKVLYPQPDLEVMGTQTGNDTRVFPGMLSTRDPMYDRTRRNTEVRLSEGVEVHVLRGPERPDPVTNPTVWEVDVQVINNAGHRIPSGYPDGRRFWVSLYVTDADSNTVYESGVYDPVEARLYNDSSPSAAFTRAQTTTIDATIGQNAVMVYEKLTGVCSGTPPSTCTQSPDIKNDVVLFDNRIPAAGFAYADYQAAGTKFYKYDANWVPTEDVTRYPEGANDDVITYRFDAPSDATLNARAEVYLQTHSREFMDFVKNGDTSTLRPEGPINTFMPGYPLSANYLFDSIPATYKVDLDGSPLSDNWGGVAYAAWLMTGKGRPFRVSADDTAYGAAVPAAPVASVSVVDPFTTMVNWAPVADAESYLLEVRLGVNDATADWMTLAVVNSGQPLSVVHTALNVAKTYGYRVRAKNGNGYGPYSTVLTVTTPTDLPLAPENLRFLSSTNTSITLTWNDVSDNEDGFLIQRQDVPVTGDFYDVRRLASTNPGGVGGVAWTDTNLPSGTTYNYRVAAYNASGASTFTVPVQASTSGTPSGQIILSATAVSGQVSLSWSGLTGVVSGYIVGRSTVGATGPFTTIRTINGDIRTYNDTSISPLTEYWYRVTLLDGTMPSNTAYVLTLPSAPAAPTNLNALAFASNEVRLSWIDNSGNETAFVIQRQLVNSPDPPIVFTTGPNVTAYIDLTVTPDMTYEYVVYATNGGGDSAFSNRVTVTTPPVGAPNPPPIPAFTATPLVGTQVAGQVPLAVTFINQTNTQGLPGSTTYLWNFGDSQTSTSANPVHTYTTAGTFSVTLTATGPGGVNSLIKVDFVNALLTPGGSLTCTIIPAEVVGAARWRIAGGTWMTSGATMTGVPPGPYVVEFLPVALYYTPNPVNVDVFEGALTTINVTYQKVKNLSPIILLLLSD